LAALHADFQKRAVIDARVVEITRGALDNRLGDMLAKWIGSVCQLEVPSNLSYA
jgi:hypothetical protein